MKPGWLSQLARPRRKLSQVWMVDGFSPSLRHRSTAAWMWRWPRLRGSVQVQGDGHRYAALKSAAAHARTMPDRIADAFRMEVADLPRSTEAERWVVQRVGQPPFRAALLDFWQGRCCVTALDVAEQLRASHIKPWASCESDDERLDMFNGLLLSPNMDARFDSGLMTIGEDGPVRLSSLLSAAAMATLVMLPPCPVKGLRSQHLEQFRYHRAFVWRT
jgi:putative restriction endonuclease